MRLDVYAIFPWNLAKHPGLLIGTTNLWAGMIFLLSSPLEARTTKLTSLSNSLFNTKAHLFFMEFLEVCQSFSVDIIATSVTPNVQQRFSAPLAAETVFSLTNKNSNRMPSRGMRQNNWRFTEGCYKRFTFGEAPWRNIFNILLVLEWKLKIFNNIKWG